MIRSFRTPPDDRSMTLQWHLGPKKGLKGFCKLLDKTPQAFYFNGFGQKYIDCNNLMVPQGVRACSPDLRSRQAIDLQIINCTRNRGKNPSKAYIGYVVENFDR